MKKISVGIFDDSFFPMLDGVALVVDNYARKLSKKCNVIVFAPNIDKNYDDSKLPYKVVRCKSIKTFFLDYVLPLPLLDFKFKKILKNTELDIIHIHSPFTLGKYAIKVARRKKIKVVATIHSQFRRDFQRSVKVQFIADMLNRKIINVFNKCDECFTVNKGMAKLYYENYNLKYYPTVISNATEMKKIINKKYAYDIINKKYNLANDEKVFLFVGRITKLKNIFFILDAFKIFSKIPKYYNYKMIFVGDGKDLLDVKKYIKDKKIPNIILAGRLADRSLLAYHYCRSDLFIFPSLYDASSIVQIEAASQKVPTIFLKNSITSSEVVDRINGIIINNEEDLANTINELMLDKKLYKKISEGAYRDLYRTFDKVVDDVYKKYLKYIEDK